METQPAFNKRMEDIQALIDTPNLIKGMALSALRSANAGRPPSHNPIHNAIQSLENIQNQSIRNSYKAIYNSACILAVSALADAFRGLFIDFVDTKGVNPDPDFKKKLSVTVANLKQMAVGSSNISNLILESDQQIKFEDLQSTIKAYKNYFQFDINLTEAEIKNIIFYTQCRHVLAHRGGRIDEAFMEKVTSQNANIKSYALGQEVGLGEDDWTKMRSTFTDVVNRLTSQMAIFG